MVAAQYAYSKGRTFTRRISAAFAVLFGLFALFFTATPKLWNSGSASQNMLDNFFTQNTAHADTPHTGDSTGACAADGASDGSGCAGACADGSAGACACGDGGGCSGADAGGACSA